MNQRKLSGEQTDGIYSETYDSTIERELKRIRIHCKLALQIKSILIEEKLMCEPVEKLDDNNYWWITMRPNSGLFKDFQKNFEISYLPNMKFDKWMYCFEQKGETEDKAGDGFHVHLIAHLPKYCQKKDLINKSKCQFAKYFGVPSSKIPEAFIEIEKISSVQHLHNLKEYMLGNKKDEYKAKACLIDPIWRTKESLLTIYKSGFQDQDPLLIVEQ